MPRRSSWRTLLVLFALGAFVGSVILVRAWMYPAEHALVGRTETVVRARYGQPKHEFTGHYGLPPLAWTQQFRGELKTGVFGRLGGDVYVTFEKRNGEWVVISNSYLPRGAAF